MLARFLAADDSAAPVQVEIAPTNRCNAQCPWCFYVAHANKPRHSRDQLEWPVLRDCLDDLAGLGVGAVSWTGGGDATVYPYFDEAVDHTAQLGLRQGLFTNGYKMVQHPEKFSWVRISVTDRLSVPATTRQYAARTQTGVVVNVTRDNTKELGRLAREARTAGASFFQVRPALAEHWSKQEPIQCPVGVRQYETDDFCVALTQYKWEDYLKPHGYPTCHGHRLVPFIWPDGSVAVCGYHFERPEFTFGNLHEERFAEIWSGPRRRRMLQLGVAVVDTCQHCCKLHEANKALARLRGELPTLHAEFV
jgi:MoaA/NifB/PqqE/SkfB family radical SAM enzyme